MTTSRNTSRYAMRLPMPCRSAWRNWLRAVLRAVTCLVWIFAAGCQPKEVAEEAVAKPPKPVSVMTLSRTKQIRRQLITATIAPWKTEQIGFEVSGRVSFVIEQNDEVQPILPIDMAAPPTPLARVDSERYRIAVEIASVDKDVAQRRLDANLVAIEQRIPAAIESAKSEWEFAQAEFRRASKIKKSISQSEYEEARNRLSVSKSALASVQAELAQARAEQSALESQVRLADQAIEEAQRNLRNTTLYSSFRGIVSEVHAVSGSFVNPGDPVATVQMMDPMLVQFEVSPKETRRYAKGDILDVLTTDSSGSRRISNGMVYTVDAVADPDSRTYTVTLHIRNHKESLLQMGVEKIEGVARTRRVFSLDVAPVITGGQQKLIEQSCLHQIGDVTVVWKIINRKANQASDPRDRVLMVEPVIVSAGTEAVTLLGQWKFVPVKFDDPSGIDFKNDLVTGKLTFGGESAGPSFNGGSDNIVDPWAPRAVVLEQQRWALRAGDVVRVVKSGASSQQGYFVPMKAILNDNGKTFLHVVEKKNTGDVIAKRIQVAIQNESVLAEDSVRLQVLPLNPAGLADGMQVVIGGSHYLADGDRVNVVQGVGE